MNWIPLESETQLDQIQSRQNYSLIFKYSTRCNVSSMVLRFFENEWKNVDGIEMYFLDLIAHRNISNKIADTFHVHHESPQVILIKNGECILDASHHDISATEIIEMISSN